MKGQIFSFDMFAMVHPKNDCDIALMLDEAIEAMSELNLIWDSIIQQEIPAKCQ